MNDINELRNYAIGLLGRLHRDHDADKNDIMAVEQTLRYLSRIRREADIMMRHAKNIEAQYDPPYVQPEIIQPKDGTPWG